MRPVKITPGFVSTADGSCLIEVGGTRVICTASFSAGVPNWRAGSGLGWVTAEYGMLPACTGQRKSRPIGKPDSRAVEIQRLIGRAMRSVVRFGGLGENTFHLDCDVLEADGGTRTAAITGAYVALSRAVRKCAAAGYVQHSAMQGALAAVSVGVVHGKPVLDLDYVEDASADVDMNIAMTSTGRYVEIQGTSEGKTFDGDQLEVMLRLAKRGIGQLIRLQKQALQAREKKG